MERLIVKVLDTRKRRSNSAKNVPANVIPIVYKIFGLQVNGKDAGMGQEEGYGKTFFLTSLLY